MPIRPPLGAHVSVAGGVSRAIERGAELGAEAIQIFVKNASQWKGKPISEEEAARFRAAHAAGPIGPVVAHATYLINLAATDRSNLARSRSTLGDELYRCDRLGISGLVLHPGSHLGAGEEKGIERIARSLDVVLRRRPEGRTPVLLEITAGQGSNLGFRLEHLAAIRERCRHADRLGVCLDTCHAFAAGYPIHTARGYRELFADLERLFGSVEPRCIHLNDSQKPLGSRRDRHANLGQGEIGLELFKRLVRDRRLRQVPMILETPNGDDGKGHARDLALLRSF